MPKSGPDDSALVIAPPKRPKVRYVTIKMPVADVPAEHHRSNQLHVNALSDVEADALKQLTVGFEAAGITYQQNRHSSTGAGRTVGSAAEVVRALLQAVASELQAN